MYKYSRRLKTHSRFREAQRFGATIAELDLLAQQIKDGEVKASCRLTETRSLYNLILNSRPVTVIWSRKYKEIVTVMYRHPEKKPEDEFYLEEFPMEDD